MPGIESYPQDMHRSEDIHSFVHMWTSYPQLVTGYAQIYPQLPKDIDTPGGGTLCIIFIAVAAYRCERVKLEKAVQNYSKLMTEFAQNVII